MSVNYIALAVPFFFLLIAAELAVAWARGMSVYRFNDSITDLGCGIGQQVTGVFVKGAMLAGYAWVFEHYRLVAFADGSLAPWAVAFFGVDFAYYWWHRLSHEVAFMWAIHVVHHQSEDYNLAVALRQAWFSGLSSWIFYLPLALLGVPPLVFVTVNSFSTLYQFWIHTRTVGRIGALEWVINAPSHHRVHHGRNPKYLDKNYAATLIVWDRLFGTYQDEEEEPLYGTIAPYASWNPVWANFDFWAHLARKARHTPRWRDRIGLWFRSPGWTPPGAPARAERDLAGEPAVRFVTPPDVGVNLYVLTQFAPLVLATVFVMLRYERMPWYELVALVGFVLVTQVVWGGLFEAKSWAVPLEIARLGAAALAAAALFLSGAIPGVASAAVALAAAGLALWALKLHGARRREVERPAVAGA